MAMEILTQIRQHLKQAGKCALTHIGTANTEGHISTDLICGGCPDELFCEKIRRLYEKTLNQRLEIGGYNGNAASD